MQFLNLKLMLFGSSHGKGVGFLIEGLDPGLKFSDHLLRQILNSYYKHSLRKEEKYVVLSGINEQNLTVGSNLVIFFPNVDFKQEDYENLKIPFHGYEAAQVRYQSMMDLKGSGELSGRCYAPITIFPSFLEEKLHKSKVSVTTKILKIGSVNNTSPSFLEEVLKMFKLDENKTYGGIVQGTITGIPKGIGREGFGKVDSLISHALFDIPGVKGVTFGFDCDLKVITKSTEVKKDDMGGVEAGLTNGEPIIVNVYFKPPFGKTTKVGRHDQTIVFKGELIIKGLLTLISYDLVKEYERIHPQKN